MMSDLVRRLRASCVGRTAAISWPHRTLHEAADRIEELEAVVLRQHGLVAVVKQSDKRIEELEAKIKAYMEAAADAAGGAPDKYAEEQRAFIALRCAINWPTLASCATLTK